MKWVLGETFRYRRSKPGIPRYQFRAGSGDQKKINLHNLYVFLFCQLYVGGIYPFLYRLVFPFSSLANRALALLVYLGGRGKLWKTIFRFFFFFYRLGLRTFARFFVNLNMFRFLCYLFMVHLPFRHPDGQLRDLVARTLRLKDDPQKSLLDSLLEEFMNSFVNFGTTDVQYHYFGSLHRRFLSFFLLYRERKSILISNKIFLEDLYALVEAYKNKDKARMDLHREHCWQRFLYFVSLLQRPSLGLLFQFFLFQLFRLFKLSLLLLVIPGLSFFGQLVVLPVVQSVLYFLFTLRTFLEELVGSFFYFLVRAFRLGAAGGELVQALVWALREKLSYQQLKKKLLRREAQHERQIIRFWKRVLTLPYLLSHYLLPTRAQLRTLFMEGVVRRDIEPTLLNGHDGFLFLHKQRSVWAKKTRTYMDSALMDHVVQFQEWKYWDYDQEDDLTEEEEEEILRFMCGGPQDNILLDQEDEEDEEDDDDEFDFWLIENNATPDFVLPDLGKLWISFRGLLFLLPGLRHLVFCLSALNIPFREIRREWHKGLLERANAGKAGLKRTYRPEWLRLLWLLIFFLALPILLLDTGWALYHPFIHEARQYGVWGVKTLVTEHLSRSIFLALAGYLWMLLGWFRLLSGLPDPEAFPIQRPKGSRRGGELPTDEGDVEEEDVWEFAILTWMALLVQLSSPLDPSLITLRQVAPDHHLFCIHDSADVWAQVEQSLAYLTEAFPRWGRHLLQRFLG